MDSANVTDPAPTYDELLARVARLEQGAAEAASAVEASRRSALQLLALIERSPMSMAIVSMDRTIDYINQRTIDTFGYLHDEIPTMDEWSARAYPDDAYRAEVSATWAALVAKAIASGREIEHAEYRVTCKDGSVKVTEIYGVIVGDKIFAMFDDLREHRLSVEALRQSEEKYRLLAATTDTGFVVIDGGGVVILANEPYQRMAGGEASESLVGRSVLEWTAPDEQESNAEAVARCARLGSIRDFETVYQQQDGTRVHISVTAAVQESREHGKHIVAFCRDITARKHAEQAKAKLAAQLQQAQKMESVGRLAGGVAHDFNNMLGVIIGRAELALARVDPSPPLREHLEEIRAAARHSADLTRQLLAFARRQTVAPQVLHLNDTVASMLAMLQRVIGENVQLSWLPGAGLWPVNVDPAQISQVLVNLCVNARDAIANVGKLVIETGNRTLDAGYCAAHPGAAVGDYVRLAVRDDGSGMSDEVLAHLFEPFFTTKEVGKGTGLGLATVYGIVEQNRGFIDVRSERGAGTTFTIYLPRHAISAQTPRPSTVAATRSPGRGTILLVEDEEAVLKLTQLMLEGLGYTVIVARAPGEALRLAWEHSGKIDLLMTDVVMPEMNGRDLAEKISSLHPNTRCLFMSGYTADVIAYHGVLDEGVQFLQKPFSTAELADKLREALGPIPDGGGVSARVPRA